MSEAYIKEVQQVELQILEQVKIICERHNLKYFADSGTLLGAIRNNQYIPWDNDIDIAMTRKDYQKFIHYAEKELEEPYYLQTAYKDKGYYSGLIKIRKSDTTAILRNQIGHKSFNQGIFLDIFPLDNAIQCKKIAVIQLKLIFFYKKLIQLKERKKISLVTSTRWVQFFLALHYPMVILCSQKVLYFMFESFARVGNIFPSKYIDKVLFRGYYGSTKLKYLPASSYKDFDITKFEDTTISIPKDTDKVLTIFYGPDYMIPKKEADCHGDVLFDVRKPYTYYLNILD